MDRKSSAKVNTSVKYRRIDFGGSKNQQRVEIADYIDNVLRFNIAMGKTAPVVYDIDATLVDEHENVIAPIASVYRKYVNIVPTYIVTARPDSKGNEAHTRAMLKRNKLDGYKGLYLMPTHATDAAQFKWRKRVDIGRLCGAHPQVTVGDQSWDAASFPVSRELRDICNNNHAGAIIEHSSGRGEIGVLLPDIPGA